MNKHAEFVLPRKYAFYICLPVVVVQWEISNSDVVMILFVISRPIICELFIRWDFYRWKTTLQRDIFTFSCVLYFVSSVRNTNRHHCKDNKTIKQFVSGWFINIIWRHGNSIGINEESLTYILLKGECIFIRLRYFSCFFFGRGEDLFGKFCVSIYEWLISFEIFLLSQEVVY